MPEENSPDLNILERSLKREKARRKEAERLLEEKSRELYQLNQELEKRVEKRTADLEVARDDALEASKAKSQFLANMSHEIRTPLNGIIGFSEILMSRPQNLDHASQQNISDIHIASINLTEVINNILDYSKIESGKMTLSIEDLDLKVLLQNAIQITKPQWQEKNQHMELHLQTSLKEAIQGDRSKINQVLLNLIGNAIKFTPPEGRVQVHADIENKWVILKVKDNGVGIPKDKIEQIFRPFEQVENHSSRQYGGTGLGLAISSRLCQTMGGSLDVESELNQGSIFTATFPFQPGQQKLIQREELQPNVNFSGKRALLIEDNPLNQRVFTQILKMMNIDVTCSSEGEEGLRQLQKSSFDFLLLDLHMPKMDGREVLIQIRKDTSLENLKVVICSADAFKERKDELLALGADAFLPKPITLKNLREVCLEFFGEERPNIAMTSNEGLAPFIKKLVKSLHDVPFARSEVLVDTIEAMMEDIPPHLVPWFDHLVDRIYAGDEPYYREVLGLG